MNENNFKFDNQETKNEELEKNRKQIPEKETEPEKIKDEVENVEAADKFLEQEASLFKKFLSGKTAKLTRIFMATTILSLAQGDYSKKAAEFQKEQEKIALINEGLELAERFPDTLLRNFETKYKDFPESEKILKKAVEEAVLYDDLAHKETALAYAHVFKSYAWGENCLKKIVDSFLVKGEKNNYYTLAKYANQFKDYPWGKEHLEEIFNHVPKEEYKLLFETANVYKDTAWGNEKLKQAAREALYTDPVTLLIYSKHFIDEPWGKEFFAKAFYKAKYYKWTDIVENIPQLKEYEWSEELIREAVFSLINEEGTLLLKNADNFKDYKWAEEAIQKTVLNIIKTDLNKAIKYASVYSSYSWGPGMLKQAAEKALNENPQYILEHALQLAGQPWRWDVIKKAANLCADRNLFSAIVFAPQYISQDWGDDVLKKAAQKAVIEEPETAINTYETYQYLPESEKFIKTAFANILKVKGEINIIFNKNELLLNFPWGKKIFIKAIEIADKEEPLTLFFAKDTYFNESWGPKIFKNAAYKIAEKNPGQLFRDLTKWQNEPYAPLLLEQVVKNDPGEFFYSTTNESRKYLETILRKSQDPAIARFLEIVNSKLQLNEKSDIALLLQKLTSGEFYLKKAAQLVKNEEEFFKQLIDIKKMPNHLAKRGLEDKLENLSLRIIQNTNNLHDEPDNVRFKKIEGMNSAKLYTLMVYGEEEIFTSTFNGLFNKLLDALKKEGQSGDELLKETGYNKFRSFIKLGVSFNRLNEFLETMAEKQKIFILEAFIKDLDKRQDMLAQAVAIADTLSLIEDQKAIKTFQETLKKEYERVRGEKNKDVETAYGILAGMFGERAVVNEEWLKKMAQKYKIEDVSGIKSEELFNRAGVNIQQYFFYDDEDGEASFKNFLAQYKNKKEWLIEASEKFITIKSVGGTKKLEIYANRPKHDSAGQAEINKILEKKNIETIVIVHRGHSFHAEETISRIPKIAKIVYLGSCGGYSNINAALDRAPQAHIISTKGTGTMTVNDPMLYALNLKIASGEDIDWPEFWKQLEHKFGEKEDFKNYVPPHKNIGVLFLKAHKKMALTY